MSTARSRGASDYLVAALLVWAYLALGALFWRPVVTLAKPDEAQHLAVLFDVKNGSLWPSPRAPIEPPFQDQQRCQPPLYYWLVALVTAPTPMLAPSEWIEPNQFFLAGMPFANGAKYIALSNGAPIVFASRMLSAALGAVALCAVFAALRCWQPRAVSALGAWVFVTLPSLLFAQTASTNIALETPLAALVIATLARIWTRGASAARLAQLAIFFALAVLTRLEAALLVLPIGLVLARSWRTDAPAHRRRIAAFGAVALAAMAIPFARNALVAGGAGVPTCLILRPAPLTPSEWLAREGEAFAKSLFVQFGEGLILGPDWAYVAVALAIVLSLLGWLRLIVARDKMNGFALVLLAYGLAVLALVVWNALSYYAGGARYVNVYGAVWAMLWAMGFAALWPRRWLAVACVGGFGASATLSLALAATALLPQYSPVWSSASSGTIAARFGDGVVLQRATIEPREVRPGDAVLVRATWRADAPVPQNFVVFVHAYAPNKSEPIAQTDTHPVHGNFPTSWWVTGQSFDDAYEVRVPADAQPGALRVGLGLYDFKTGARLTARATSGAELPNATVDVGEIQISK